MSEEALLMMLLNSAFKSVAVRISFPHTLILESAMA
jgi:hypothetical protein